MKDNFAMDSIFAKEGNVTAEGNFHVGNFAK
jgi:hypothetical protein